MSIFDLRLLIIEEYGKYVQSFFSIADERVREFIKEEVLVKRALWPDDLLQISAPYERAVRVEDLVNRGKLNPFRMRKANDSCFLILNVTSCPKGE